MESLKEAVKASVQKTLQSLANSHFGESVCGYALLTDDDLQSLGYLAVTREYLERHGNESRYEITDWPYADGVEAFDEPRRLMGECAQSSHSHRDHVDASFGALVEALHDLRLAGVFANDVFLTAASTDPSEHLEQLEDDAARILNEREIYKGWRASISG
ncbi:MAG: DUF4303 domain-containing protein [Pseudomarimonas sp.]